MARAAIASFSFSADWQPGREMAGRRPMTMAMTAQQIQSQPDEAELERASALAVVRLLRAGGYGRDRALGRPYDSDSDAGGQDDSADGTWHDRVTEF